MSFFENTRKPVGLGGKIMVAMKNFGHSAMAEWGLRFLQPAPDAMVLDCGCGGGANIKTLLKLCSNGKVQGIDYSAVSVEKARKVNARAIAAGRCTVQQASVAELPFEAEQFDAVTAFETVYFWPELAQNFREVYRVLKPSGIFCGCFYVKGEQKRTDWFVRHIYEKTGFFTPPYETAFSLKKRLEKRYATVTLGTVKSMAWFACRKAE
ncbi:MAG: class I SAM-dependent methyltransferase [Faecalibacterium prausnitzii]|nr:class I SAM-dependent methyltransferase [Faecalibacterium prausnitzii]